MIDLESVWSVKDIVLDNSAKSSSSSTAAAADVHIDTQQAAKASTSYYSRHGQYKTNTGKYRGYYMFSARSQCHVISLQTDT